MIEISRPVLRDTGVIFQRRHLVIRIERSGIRIKGLRERWSKAALVDWASLASFAWKLRARQIVIEKKERRAAKRAAVLALLSGDGT